MNHEEVVVKYIPPLDSNIIKGICYITEMKTFIFKIDQHEFDEGVVWYEKMGR